jgi:hypothetical protein
MQLVIAPTAPLPQWSVRSLPNVARRPAILRGLATQRQITPDRHAHHPDVGTAVTAGHRSAPWHVHDHERSASHDDAGTSEAGADGHTLIVTGI